MDKTLQSKSPKESQAEVLKRMFPTDANPAGNVFGGEIVKQIDTIAGIVAQRHCQCNAVTACIDRVVFHKPVFVGDVLILNGRITYVGKTSMEIEVKVESENLRTNKITHTHTAFVTMVALDEKGHPTRIFPLKLETLEEKKQFEQGKLRMEQRKKIK
jgi:acyl-CoA hydrolase